MDLPLQPGNCVQYNYVNLHNTFIIRIGVIMSHECHIPVNGVT